MEKNIYLIGFMGCGKTSVGKKVAELTGTVFIDCDDEIIKREGCVITEIFKRYGEKYFRDVESQVLKEIASRRAVCVATGGGIVKSEANVDLMKETGIVFWLDVAPETALKRLEGDQSRPILLVEDRLSKIKELISQRQPLYTKAGDYKIETDGRAIDDIACEIASLYRQYGLRR